MITKDVDLGKDGMDLIGATSFIFDAPFGTHQYDGRTIHKLKTPHKVFFLIETLRKLAVVMSPHPAGLPISAGQILVFTDWDDTYDRETSKFLFAKITNVERDTEGLEHGYTLASFEVL